MNTENKNIIFDKRLLIKQSLIALLFLLITGFVIWFFLKDYLEMDTKIIENVNQATELESKHFNGQLESLDGYFNGIRESMDGSIEPVLLQISDVNKNDLSFTYVLNIGTNKRFTGIGIIESDNDVMKMDMIGDLKYSMDKNGSILLNTFDDDVNTKYKLIQERK